MESRKLGNIYGFDGGNYAGNVYDKNDIAPTLTNMQGGNRQPMVIEEVVRMGGLYDKPEKKHQMGSVFDKECLAPTIDTMQGGYREPMIIDEVKELGFMDNGTGKHQSNTVVDENGLAPTVTTVNGGGTQQIKVLTEVEALNTMPDGTCRTIKSQYGNTSSANFMYSSTYGATGVVAIKQSIVAMRGRNPENPSDRTVGAPTEQRLEPNSQGICNTLTSVTKDNLVLEKNVAALRMVRTEEGKALRKQYENHEITHGFNEYRIAEPREDGCSNTLSTVQKDNMLLETVRIKQATKDGYIECKVGGVADLSFPDSTTRRGRVQDGGDVCPTLMAGEQDICRIEKADNGVLEINNREEAYINELIESGVLENPGIYSYDGYNNKVNDTGVIGTVVPQNNRWGMTNGHKVIDTTVEYRIRKLTPRECYRLMAVPEKDIDKMLEVNSNTQCYKQAGNSIVVNCLIAIFSQMGIQGIPRWNEGLSEKYK